MGVGGEKWWICVQCQFLDVRDLPSWKLTYPIPVGTFEDDFPFPQVGYVNSLEGTLPETNSFGFEHRPGPKRQLNYSNHSFFQVRFVSFREGI